jgi:ADP-heptose:LPS heptosyltransferase
MVAKQPPPAQPIINLGPDIRDFADTSAIVAQLDLVICVDTAVAHVAGALGKPCWVLIPAFGTDWRWLQDRTGSPWYPGALRIFRQKTPDEWDDTVGEVVTMLKTLVSNVNEKNSLAPLTAPFSR